MTLNRLVCALLLAPLSIAAQQSPPAISLPAVAPPSHSITLDVVVNDKRGQLIPGLKQQDFTIFDNKSAQPITSFKIMTPAKEPVEAILFIDAVNTPYELVAYIRDSTEKFLKEKEGTLAHPTNIAVLTDDGVQIGKNFSPNGNLLSDTLAHYQIGLRDITRSSQWGDSERLQISLKALNQLVTYAATLPGRKIILFISPGWPLLSGPTVYLDSKQQDQIFGNVVFMSTELRRAGITLYNINPIGVTEPILQANYYEDFLKGLTKPSDAQYAHLSLQVLAVQSGGLTLVTNSDVTGNIEKCLADADSWYEITFDPPPPDKPNQYHHIEIRLDHPGLIARTRDGYYSNPVAVSSGR